MPDEPTCGKGLVANAPLPRALAEAAAAMAENLERHVPALAPDDPERPVYEEIAASLRRGAEALGAAAERMAGQAELPMGPHDEAVLAAPEVASAFERLVRAEEALAALLAARAPGLAAMRGEPPADR
jgi:hypothetical protein